MTTRESATVESGTGINLDVRIYKPDNNNNNKDSTSNDEKIVVVLVHPYSVLGGCQALMKGIARNLADNGIAAVTFDMRGAGKSTGRPSITGFSEVSDVIAICKWTSKNLSSNRILLVGSSAGAPIAGSAVDQVDEVIGYVSLGYPFGLTASILFGRHHKAILQSPKPKLFVMGTKDGFTSVKQLANKVKSAAGRAETHLIEGVSHFQMEELGSGEKESSGGKSKKRSPSLDAHQDVMALDQYPFDAQFMGGFEIKSYLGSKSLFSS